MNKLSPELIKKVLGVADGKQFVTLTNLIASGKVLSAYQQKKYDEYMARLEEAQRPESPYAMSVRAIADFFGVSEVAVYKWRQKETFPREAEIKRGLLDLRVVFRWWKEYFFGDEAMAKAMAEERLKYQQARARREELIVMELEGKMKRVEDINRDLALVFGAVATHIKSLYLRLPPLLATNGQLQKYAAIIEGEANQTLAMLSEGLNKLQGNIDEVNRMICDACRDKLFTVTVNADEDKEETEK